MRMVYVSKTVQPHTILRDKRYFLKLTLIKVNVSITFGTTNLVEGSGRANIMLPNGIRFHINDASYYDKYRRSFLSFKDICKYGYHIEIINEGNVEYIYITSIISGRSCWEPWITPFPCPRSCRVHANLSYAL